MRGTSAARIKRQSQLPSPARNGIGSSEQRNKWQGPACGKAAVYAGCDLEPIPLRAPAPRAVLVGEVFYSIGLAPRFVDFFKLVQQFNLLALTTFAVPNASFFSLWLLGLSFYPFE